MPIQAPHYRLTSIIVHGAPEHPGVYALWQDEEMIYLGRAVSIKKRLLEHLDRSESQCITDATHYTWELSLRPEQREADLLQEFYKRYGRLPRCNAA
jgi:excinuclease UvrABC nuclease subunit